MSCLVVPLCKLSKCCTKNDYRRLREDGLSETDSAVTVVVGTERKEFLVDRFVLQESPFRCLLKTVKSDGDNCCKDRCPSGNIYIDVDSILFEHMLWLMNNDCPSFFKLDLEEIIDFYMQDC